MTECVNDIQVVKKHRAIINCENSIPLASRKIFNILLFLVKDRFGKDIEHYVQENDVMALLNKSDRDITIARQNYKKLGSIAIAFNLLNSERDHLEGVGTLLAPAIVNRTKKLWEFSFPPNIVKWIQEPGSFVFLDINTQEKFSSKYSQALWEICIGSIGDKLETKFSVALDECRVLLCGKDNSLEYKDFKRRVVMIAIKEINDKTHINVNLENEIRNGKKVCELVFNVSKQSETLIVGEDNLRDDLLHKMTHTFGITKNVAEKISKSFEIDQIIRNLEYTEEQYRKAVKNNRSKSFNLGAYATSAIMKNYAPEKPALITQVTSERNIKSSCITKNMEMKNAEREAMNKIAMDAFRQLDGDTKLIYMKEFEMKGMLGPCKRDFIENGWSDNIYTQLVSYLLVKIEVGSKGDGYDDFRKGINNKLAIANNVLIS